MPSFRDSMGRHVVSCVNCTTQVTVDTLGRDAVDYVSGRPANDVFVWVNSSDRAPHFRSRCRACFRANERRSRASLRTARRNAYAATATTTSAAPGVALGLSRTYGIEIECIATIGQHGVEAALSAAGITGWRVKYDGSLSQGGVEVVSPVLSGEEGLDAIRRVTRVLRDAGCRVNRSCGLHVHHGIRDLSIAAVRRAARSWANNQTLIDGLVSESRRDGRNTYCQRLSSRDLSIIESATALRDLEYIRVDRYRTFNLACYGRFGTAEIRQHQGTLDAEKIISWVMLGKAIFDTAAVNDSQILTQRTLRDLFAALGNRLDETARTFLTGRAVEFGAVTV